MLLFCAPVSRANIRFGSAELYTVLEAFNELADTLAIGQPICNGDDERVVLFCKMATGHTLTPDLVTRIKREIRSLLSPRHVPAVIMEIAEIPYTLTGKKVSVAVKRILQGKESSVENGTALANPQSLQLYRDALKDLSIK